MEYKTKLILFRNVIDCLLSLEEYIWEKDGEIPKELARKIELLYQHTNGMVGQELCGLEVVSVLEEVLAMMKEGKGVEKQMIPPVVIQEQEELYGETELFMPDGRNCGESPFIETTLLQEPMRLPFLIRKSTKEKILINRDVFKIGKEKSYVDYYVDNDAVSRSHADIIRRKDNFFVVDQDSLNHTFLEGKQIPAKQYIKLDSGQSFVLANEEFTFYYEPIN